jgi:phage terminase small subunit
MLNAKQKMFIEEYLLDMNASQAAIRAGYSPRSAKVLGCKSLKNPEVQAAIAARLAERGKQLGVEQDQVLLEIARIAFNDPRLAFDANGALLPVQRWSADLAAAVAAVKVHELKAADGSVLGACKEIKFWDKGKQLELAARHLGMLNDKLVVTTPVAELIRAARARIRQQAG